MNEPLRAVDDLSEPLTVPDFDADVGGEIGELMTIVAGGLIHAVYQPLVDLYSGEIVGYEALARGPKGSLARPDQLFAVAKRADMVFELDQACRAAAIKGAVDCGLTAPSTLFVNVEPEALDVDRRGGAGQDLIGTPKGTRLIVELTERAVTDRVADVIPTTDALRARGLGIALDDVGVNRRSLALLPFLRPDVIKLDLRLTQDPPSERIAEVHNAVAAHAERTNAVVVAEGIETEEHAERARAMGATIGQGWLYGRPGPLERQADTPRVPVRIAEPVVHPAATPFESILGSEEPRRATKRLLLAISTELERHVLTLGESGVLLSTFQDGRFFHARQALRYADMARTLAFVGVVGKSIGPHPAPGVRGASLTDDDPLVLEWDVIVLGPHFAGALTARDVGDTTCGDLDRRFDFKLTHDRDLVVRAARSLMSRMAPADDVPRPSIASNDATLRTQA